MNASEFWIYGELLGALILTVIALRSYLNYRYLRCEAKALETECRKAVYFSSPEIYSRNCGADESKFIRASIETFRPEYGGRSRRILLTMAFAKPEDRFAVEPVVRECTNERINLPKNQNLFVHLHTTLSTE